MAKSHEGLCFDEIVFSCDHGDEDVCTFVCGLKKGHKGDHVASIAQVKGADRPVGRIRGATLIWRRDWQKVDNEKVSDGE